MGLEESINSDDFPSNSRKKVTPIKRNPEVVDDKSKNIEKVITGDAVRRKKSLGKRFMETFGVGDAKGVLEYVMLDVLIPAAKDMFADAASQGIERMIFGEARSTSRRTGQRPSSSNSNGYVSYNRYSRGATNVPVHREEPRTNISRRSRSSHNFDEIILATRVEAEEVIDRLFDLISRYESATVADLYELVGISGDYTDEKWGWTDFRGAGVTRVRNGYLLDLPKPELID